MNDEALRAAYALLLEERAARDDCATPEALLTVVNGTASEAERLRALRHVAECRKCHADLEFLRAAGDAAGRAVRGWRRPLFAAAASVFLIAGGATLWRAMQPSAETMREGARAVQLLAPAERPIALPVRLIWAQVPGARRYQVEIVRLDGAPAYAVVTSDTVLAVPEAAALATGGEYRWWVRALMADGTQPRSAPRRLRISTP